MFVFRSSKRTSTGGADRGSQALHRHSCIRGGRTLAQRIRERTAAYPISARNSAERCRGTQLEIENFSEIEGASG